MRVLVRYPDTLNQLVLSLTDEVPRTIYTFGGYLMFITLGAPVDPQLMLWSCFEWSHILAIMLERSGVPVAACEPRNVQAATLFSKRLKQLHAFNREFYATAQVTGDAYTVYTASATSVAECAKELYQLLETGNAVVTDGRNGLPMPLSDPLFTDLNNKNWFGALVKGAELPLSIPRTIPIHLSKEVIDVLLEASDDDIQKSFVRSIEQFYDQAGIDPSIPYFIKIAVGAGGDTLEKTMARLRYDTEQGNRLRCVLEAVRKKLDTVSTGAPLLQLQEPVHTRVPNNLYPLDEHNREYFSPCVTYRITEAETVMGQVCDQVLRDGITWVGAYWNADQEQKFLERVPQQALMKLSEKIRETGYRGYFGCDFVQQSNGQYMFILDANARQNGSDLLLFARRALAHHGKSMCDGFLGSISFDWGTENLSDLRDFQYAGDANAGVVLFPGSAQPFDCKKLRVIYINPSLQPDRFESFFKKYF